MKYAINLSVVDRSVLEHMVSCGSAKARVLTRARVLLLSDHSQGDARSNGEIMDALQISTTLLFQTRKRYIAEGLDSALQERARPGHAPVLTGDVEAQMTMLACSDPPEGHARWTVRLLADKLVELNVVEEISHVAVHKKLKKMNLSLGESKVGA